MCKVFVRTGLFIVLFLYLLVLSKLILFKQLPLSEIIRHFSFNSESSIFESHNFIPLKTITYYLLLADVNLNIRIENLVGNIIGFGPFGFMLPLLTKRFSTKYKIIAATFGLSLMYELIQLIFKFGSFDVDDLILNTIGGLIGYWIFNVCRGLWRFYKWSEFKAFKRV
jgi:glycopeptide antibiotics resistance protein